MQHDQHEPTGELESNTKETMGQRAARWIDDPTGSVVAGTIFPTAAIGVVVGGIFGLGMVV
ncbi:MAG: hypothetical protein AAF993_09910 [Pseudomonadota bacterium]